MPKGRRRIDESNEQEQRVRDAANILYGRLGAEIEFYAHSKAINAVELTTWVGALLLSAGEWTRDHVSVLSESMEAREGRGPASTLESSRESHGGRTPRGRDQGTRTDATRKTSKTAAREVNPRGSGVKAFWAAMTPAQRSREMKKRQKKWSAEALAKWRGQKAA